MVYCSVFGCKSNDNKLKEKKWRFFYFPKDEILCKQWIKSCSRKDKINTKNARICSEHFLETDFTNLKDKLLNVPLNKRKLNYDAVPSVKLHKLDKTVNEITEREKRLKQKEQSELCNILIKNSLETSPIKEEPPDIEIVYVAENGLDQKSQQIFNVESDNIRLRKELNILKKSNKILKQKDFANENLNKNLKKIFSENQIRLLQTNKRIIWTAEDISSSISLHSLSPRAYRYLLEKGFPFPGCSTLRKWSKSPAIIQKKPTEEVVSKFVALEK